MEGLACLRHYKPIPPALPEPQAVLLCITNLKLQDSTLKPPQHHQALTKYASSLTELYQKLTKLQMLARTAMRAPNMVARRGFHSTRAQMSSPYHYPEGPRSNIPFNPLTKLFAVRYWAFMGA